MDIYTIHQGICNGEVLSVTKPEAIILADTYPARGPWEDYYEFDNKDRLVFHEHYENNSGFMKIYERLIFYK